VPASTCPRPKVPWHKKAYFWKSDLFWWDDDGMMTRDLFFLGSLEKNLEKKMKELDGWMSA
jgi:hypothetical protein